MLEQIAMLHPAAQVAVIVMVGLFACVMAVMLYRGL